MLFKSAAVFAVLSSTLAVPTVQSRNGEYLVKLKQSTDSSLRSQDKLESHLGWLEEMISSEASLRGDDDSKLLNKFDGFGETFKAYHGKFSDEILAKIQENEDVELVEPNGKKHIYGGGGSPGGLTWGLDRIDQESSSLDGKYTPNFASQGEGVTVYVLDTGIDASHPDFGGRAAEGAYFEDTNAVDGHGHGTHCAGTIASNTYGVAKKAKVVGVKVLSSEGSGSDAGVIKGVEWVISQAKPGKAVASMSLGGEKSQILDDAINAAVAKGIPFSVAAGNDSGKDACPLSPAGASSAYTVGSTAKGDSRSGFSNIGKCVKIFAPGSSIKSTWKNGGYNTISGTSMACPHVSGAFALLLSDPTFEAYTVPEIYDVMTNSALVGKISNVGESSPNKLLFVGTKA